MNRYGEREDWPQTTEGMQITAVEAYGNEEQREPTPPTPPLLDDHPYVRITQYQGFREYDFDPAKRISVPLTRAEIRTLAQHHLDRIDQFEGFIQCGGAYGNSDIHRDNHHRGRFVELSSMLPDEDREKFNEIIEIRDRYIETLYDPEEGLR